MKYNKVRFGLQFDFQFMVCVVLSIFLGHIIWLIWILGSNKKLHVPSSNSGLVL